MSNQQAQLTGLDSSACLRLLRQHRTGRVAVTIDHQPHIVAVNYAADEEGNVAFRTGLDTVLIHVDHERVAFEIDGIDENSQSGWSVCVHGFGREITDVDDPACARLRRKLGESWAPGPRPRWFVIHAGEVTGRRLREPAGAEMAWFPGIPCS
jgi:nitroimidazol reductase NimA-like FMN-containing flavoprotein (pyridoxamine 5'-phosphate oxidase superfamily)